MPLHPNGPAPYTSVTAGTAALEAFRDRGLGTPITPEILTRAGVPESISRRTLQSLVTLSSSLLRVSRRSSGRNCVWPEATRNIEHGSRPGSAVSTPTFCSMPIRAPIRSTDWSKRSGAMNLPGNAARWQPCYSGCGSTPGCLLPMETRQHHGRQFRGRSGRRHRRSAPRRVSALASDPRMAPSSPTACRRVSSACSNRFRPAERHGQARRATPSWPRSALSSISRCRSMTTRHERTSRRTIDEKGLSPRTL